MKAVRMASYADADRTVFGSAGQEHEISAPGGAYSPVLCQPPILESISTVLLTV